MLSSVWPWCTESVICGSQLQSDASAGESTSPSRGGEHEGAPGGASESPTAPAPGARLCGVQATMHPSIGAAVLCTLSAMQGGEVIRRARRWSGLSQVELGDRLGVPASTVATWEASDPDFSLVERVVRASGHELHRVVAEADPDPHDVALIDANLQLTVDERFERLAAHVRFIEAGRAALRATR